MRNVFLIFCVNFYLLGLNFLTNALRYAKMKSWLIGGANPKLELSNFAFYKFFNLYI